MKVIRGYLETVSELPWNRLSEETYDIRRAQLQLDKDHHGLDKVRTCDAWCVRFFPGHPLEVFAAAAAGVAVVVAAVDVVAVLLLLLLSCVIFLQERPLSWLQAPPSSGAPFVCCRLKESGACICRNRLQVPPGGKLREIMLFQAEKVIAGGFLETSTVYAYRWRQRSDPQNTWTEAATKLVRAGN